MQKTSNLSQDSNERTFRYEFLQELILEELFGSTQNMENRDFYEFQDEFLGGSSYFWVMIC